MVDSLIRLFESSDIDFTTNGIGSLPDASACVVTEERNGMFELEMEYPITGTRYSDIAFRRIIVAKSTPFSDPQPFRIYSVSKPLNGMVTVNAAHISYDLSGYTVAPFSADSVSEAFVNMMIASDIPAEQCPFTFWTNKETQAHMSTSVPLSIRSILGGTEGSILDTYRGEYEFDGFYVKLRQNRGADNGVTLRYGKNITSLKQDENCSNVYTAVRPYWYKEGNDDHSGYVDLPEKILGVSGTFDYTKVMPLDLSDQFDSKPSADALRNAAQQYINEHDIGIPTVSLTVSFVQLADSDEYKNVALFEKVQLCDTVTVEFPKLGVSAKSKCVKTVYDVLRGRYDKIELGTLQANLSTTISVQGKTISEATPKTLMERVVSNATKLITGNLGGYVVMQDSNGDGEPDEILIMDTNDINTAEKVWRWNNSGLGYSSNGYNGPYETAITQNGEIVANFITAGTMSADLIKGGVLALGSNIGQNGKLVVYDEQNHQICILDQNGLTMPGSNGKVVIDYSHGFVGKNSQNQDLYWASEDEFHMKKSVVEDEITLCGILRFIKIQDGSNDGIGLVSVEGS